MTIIFLSISVFVLTSALMIITISRRDQRKREQLTGRTVRPYFLQ